MLVFCSPWQRLKAVVTADMVKKIIVLFLYKAELVYKITD